jgi:hypothetical protein
MNKPKNILDANKNQTLAIERDWMREKEYHIVSALKKQE